MRAYPCPGGGRRASWGGSRGNRASGARTCGATSSPPPPPYQQHITNQIRREHSKGGLDPAAGKRTPPTSQANPGEGRGGREAAARGWLTCGGVAARDGQVGEEWHVNPRASYYILAPVGNAPGDANVVWAVSLAFWAEPVMGSLHIIFH